MNEDEARKKWCPFVRQHPPSGTRGYATNKPQYSDTKIIKHPDLCCIGSECMAWRWQMVIEHQVPLGLNSHVTDSDGNRLGYCGLAGDL